MTGQLRLADTMPLETLMPSWRLDDDTRRRGRAGIATARAVLAAAAVAHPAEAA